jgi:hypothetical protein
VRQEVATERRPRVVQASGDVVAGAPRGIADRVHDHLAGRGQGRLLEALAPDVGQQLAHDAVAGRGDHAREVVDVHVVPGGAQDVRPDDPAGVELVEDVGERRGAAAAGDAPGRRGVLLRLHRPEVAHHRGGVGEWSACETLGPQPVRRE